MAWKTWTSYDHRDVKNITRQKMVEFGWESCKYKRLLQCVALLKSTPSVRKDVWYQVPLQLAWPNLNISQCPMEVGILLHPHCQSGLLSCLVKPHSLETNGMNSLWQKFYCVCWMFTMPMFLRGSCCPQVDKSFNLQLIKTKQNKRILAEKFSLISRSPLPNSLWRLDHMTTWMPTVAYCR